MADTPKESAVTLTTVTPQPEYKVSPSYVDVTFPAALMVTGSELSALHAQLRAEGWPSSSTRSTARAPASP